MSNIRSVYVFLNSTFTCFRERKHCGKATSLSIPNKVLFFSKRENCFMIHLVPERRPNVSLKAGLYPKRESIF